MRQKQTLPWYDRAKGYKKIKKNCDIKNVNSNAQLIAKHDGNLS
jgi:hypothetical protein